MIQRSGLGVGSVMRYPKAAAPVSSDLSPHAAEELFLQVPDRPGVTYLSGPGKVSLLFGGGRKSLVVASYNVKNFCLTPIGDGKSVTQPKSAQSIEEMANVIRNLNADILTLQEIHVTDKPFNQSAKYVPYRRTRFEDGEPQPLVDQKFIEPWEELNQKYWNGRYQILLFPTNSERGMGIALLFNTKSRQIQLLETREYYDHTFRRAFVLSKFRIYPNGMPKGANSPQSTIKNNNGDAPIDLWFGSLHLKSKIMNLQSYAIRLSEAKRIREILDGLRREEPDAKIILMGDFNTSPARNVFYRDMTDEERKDSRLFNTIFGTYDAVPPGAPMPQRLQALLQSKTPESRNVLLRITGDQVTMRYQKSPWQSIYESIDHGAISPNLLPHLTLSGPFGDFNPAASDHRPIRIKLSVAGEGGSQSQEEPTKASVSYLA
jgi:endonuclease/exonuclease/phosphatase family metal-dependent hydrolase